MFQSFSFGFLKPDALEDGLEDEIFERIEGAGLTVLAKRRITLTQGQIEKIYPHISNLPFLEGVKEYLVGREAIVFLVGAVATNAIEVLGRIKGHNHESGTIRGDLVRDATVWYSGEEIKLWEEGKHPNQKEVSLNRMMLNRLHSADDEDGVRRCIRKFFNPEELLELSQKFRSLGALLAD